MKSWSLLVILLVIATGFGLYYRRITGVIRRKRRLQISPKEFGGIYGARATILQFSTTFCSSCRTAKALISDVVKGQADINYFEIDAESNLNLIRKVDIRSTPTTLFLERDG